MKITLNELRNLVKQTIEEDLVKEGVGFELYSKGADRIAKQTEQVSKLANEFADLTRNNATTLKRKRKLNELKKWINSINTELKYLEDDFDNLEGY